MCQCVCHCALAVLLMPLVVRTAVDEARLRDLVTRGKKAGISEEFMIRVNVRRVLVMVMLVLVPVLFWQ